MKIKKLAVTLLLIVVILCTMGASVAPTNGKTTDNTILPKDFMYPGLTLVSTDEYTDDFGKTYVKETYESNGLYQCLFYCPEISKLPFGKTGASHEGYDLSDARMYTNTAQELAMIEHENMIKALDELEKEVELEQNNSDLQILEDKIQSAIDAQRAIDEQPIQ